MSKITRRRMQIGFTLHSTPRTAVLATVLIIIAGSARAADKVAAKEFYVEPPTLVSLGFEWQIDGDANHNAAVTVSYHKKGTETWKQGLPLMRLDQ